MGRLERANWGTLPYEEALVRQREWVSERLSNQRMDTLVFVEHPEVITLGRKRGAEANVLAAEGVPVLTVERGGDATWHGPGQLVAYPIVWLQEGQRDAHLMLRALEEATLKVLRHLGLRAVLRPKFTGVWIEREDGELRKIASIGIALERWCTFHGLALNLDCSLEGFAKINPCGLDAQVMTSLEACGIAFERAQLESELHHELARALGFEAS